MNVMDKLLKSSEVMEILSIKRGKLKELVSKRKLYPLPDFNKWRFSKKEVELYIENQKVLSKRNNNIDYFGFENEEMKSILATSTKREDLYQ